MIATATEPTALGSGEWQALNLKPLARMQRRQRLAMFLLFAPALGLIAVFLLLPIGWLLYLSFVQRGEFSLVHYERMVTYTSYVNILLTTLRISAITTTLCVLLGYPVAYLVAQLPRHLALLCIAMIIIPFWTSLLVRTYAWLVLLSGSGPVSATLAALRLLHDPLGLIFNETGTIIGMTHIMLPFFILPLYANLKSFDWIYMQAAASLGASPLSAFLAVFLPLSLPGLAAGATLVFVQCLGFYVTPAILGGGKVTTVAMKIATNVEQYFDWGAASAFGVILLITAVSILVVATRFLSIGRILRI